MADGKKNGGAMDEAKNVAKKKAKKKIVGAILGAVSQLIIPILIIVVLIASVMLIAQQITNMINGIKDGWSSFWNRDGIVVSDEFVDEFIKNLKAQGIGVGSMGMTESNAKDYIKSFIEASLVTQTVNTHNNGIAVAGGIELKRHDSRDNQLHDMSYTEAFDEGADFNKIRYTYSLDESGNIVYPVSNGSGGYTTRTIDKSAYEQHAIPVMFFVDLCTATQSPNYVKALSDHIKNEGQTMTITLLDSYYVSYKEVHHEYIASGATNHTWDTQEDSTTTISTMPYVTEVNHLLYKMSQTYTRSEPSVKRTDPETVETKGKGAEANVTLRTTTTTVTETYRFSSPIEQDPVIKCEEDDFFVKESKKKYYTSYKQNAAAINTYKKDGALLFTMMDMNLDNDRLEQILKYVIYKMTGVDYGVTSLDGSLFKLNSINKLGAGGIAEVIRSFENGDLWAYIKGDSNDYSNWLVNKYCTQDRKKYKLGYDADYNTWDFAYGIKVYDKNGYNNVNEFNEEEIDIKDLVDRARRGEEVTVDVEPIHRIFAKLVANKRKILSDAAARRNADLTSYQLDALTNVHYQYGNAGEFYGSSSKNVMELYKQYYAKGKVEEFRNRAICQLGDNSDDTRQFFIIGEPPKRAKYEWIMFNEGKYLLADGTEISAGGEFGGVSSEEEAAALEKIIEEQYLNTKVHNNWEYQSGPLAKWWSKAYNPIARNVRNGEFQCTWWAWGRASQYLEQIGSKYSQYPTAYGDGGEYYITNVQGGWFKYGKEPKPNSIVSWTQGTDSGHVAYVEGVTSDGIYISHAGNGSSWFGVVKIPLDGTIWPGSGYQLNGYIYLDEPN